MRTLEPKLSDEVREELANIFYELAVLYGMQRLVDMGYVEEEKG